MNIVSEWWATYVKIQIFDNLHCEICHWETKIWQSGNILYTSNITENEKKYTCGGKINSGQQIIIQVKLSCRRHYYGDTQMKVQTPQQQQQWQQSLIPLGKVQTPHIPSNNLISSIIKEASYYRWYYFSAMRKTDIAALL